MTASITVLPVIARERVTEDVRMQVSLSRLNYGKLCKRAAGFNMRPEELVAAIVSDALNPTPPRKVR